MRKIEKFVQIFCNILVFLRTYDIIILLCVDEIFKRCLHNKSQKTKLHLLLEGFLEE